MSLSPGQRLGPYEVVAPIGAGGMGEVYRARDTQLHRDVALKVLPDALAHDRERLARFEREARTLASLNHPNIAQIHGLEQFDAPRPGGQTSSIPDGGQTPSALVLEYIEGEDLAQRIARGALPFDEALPIARQIADALEAAHDRGVIHRDLKPSNVKVREDGVVKLLDFGLAKALSPDADVERSGSLANSPTMTSPAMTQQGLILGTAAFMSPEQAKGRPVDRRADIWAFGVLLYEMLTGRQLFEGESVSDTLAAVLRQDIDLALLPDGTPPELRRIVARCLDRDPRTRLRDIGEARVVLSSPLADQAEPVPAAAPAAGARGRSRLAWIAAGLVAGAGLLAGAQWTMGRAPGAGSADDQPGAMTLRQLTDLPGPERHPDISPDGRQVLYTSNAAGNADVYLLRVGGTRAINLTASSADDDEQARFSPSGDQIVFRSSRDGGGLFLMGATGESVRRLTNAGYDPEWSPDGRRIAYSTEGVLNPYGRQIFAELWTVDVATADATRVYVGDAVEPAWSPDGSRIAYWANTGGQRDIWTIPADGGTPEAVTQDAATDWSPAWSPDGRWLYFASDRSGSMNVWRVAIDQATGRAHGDPQPVTSSVRPLASVRLSADGTRMIAMGYDFTTDITVYGFDPAAPDRLVLRTAMRNQAFSACSPSPDGAWLACYSPGAHEDLVLVRSDGSDARRLMDDEFKDRGATWSPDGRTIAFYSTRAGTWETWAIQADGSGLRQLTTMDQDTSAMAWSPDGRSGIVSSVSTRTAWRLDTSKTNSLPSVESLEDVADAGLLDVQSWSASGSLVAGALFLDPMTVMPAVWDFTSKTLRTLDLPATSAGTSVTFLPDSRRLLVSSTRGLMLVDLAGGPPRLLRAGEPGDAHRLSRDGRTLVIEHPVFDADVWLLDTGTAASGHRPDYASSIQPRAFMAIPAFHIFVMCRMRSPSKSITYT